MYSPIIPRAKIIKLPMNKKSIFVIVKPFGIRNNESLPTNWKIDKSLTIKIKIINKKMKL